MGNEEINYDEVLKRLTEIEDQLIKVNRMTGALDRANAMRNEIMSKGWNYIVEKYHPDVNTTDPAANELYAMYKFVYETMWKRLEVKASA